MLDINAQVRYQKQHRSPETGLEPFVGAIVSPYGESLANAQSQISFFNVVHPGDRDLSVGADPIAEGCLPMAMDVNFPAARWILASSLDSLMQRPDRHSFRSQQPRH